MVYIANIFLIIMSHNSAVFRDIWLVIENWTRLFAHKHYHTFHDNPTETFKVKERKMLIGPLVFIV